MLRFEEGGLDVIENLILDASNKENPAIMEAWATGKRSERGSLENRLRCAHNSTMNTRNFLHINIEVLVVSLIVNRLRINCVTN